MVAFPLAYFWGSGEVGLSSLRPTTVGWLTLPLRGGEGKGPKATASSGSWPLGLGLSTPASGSRDSQDVLLPSQAPHA